MAKVMVVDDAYSELKMMEDILKSGGLDVVCFPDGDHLEERMVQERPDVLLLDIVMPNRNGYEILRSLKRDERTKKIKSLGDRSLAQARRALGQGDQGYRGPDQERPERHAGSCRGHGTGDARGRVRLSDDGAGG